MCNKIAERMVILGLSQRAIARLFKDRYGKSSVTGSLISKWIGGQQPMIENAMILAEILQCKVEDLWTLE